MRTIRDDVVWFNVWIILEEEWHLKLCMLRLQVLNDQYMYSNYVLLHTGKQRRLYIITKVVTWTPPKNNFFKNICNIFCLILVYPFLEHRTQYYLNTQPKNIWIPSPKNQPINQSNIVKCNLHNRVIDQWMNNCVVTYIEICIWPLIMRVLCNGFKYENAPRAIVIFYSSVPKS